MFTCSIASILNSLAFFAKSSGEIIPLAIEPFKDHCANEILYFLALILFSLSTSNEAKPNNEDDIKPEKFLLFKTSILSITKYKNLIMNCNFMKINHLMKIKTIPLFLMLFLISCKNEPAKERFSYERVQENENKTVNNEQTVIVLNSNDLMLFDKTSLSAKAGKNIRLVLNHTGKIGKEFMGHNFVLLKKDVDVDDFAMLALDFKENEYIPKNNDFIVHTRMLGGGESDTINFTIEEPGSYTYVCTFPGHYQIMQGILTIE